MVLDLKEKILLKKFEHGCIESYLDLFNFYESSNDSRALWYLKQFLLHYKPEASMRIYAKKHNRPYSQDNMRSDYIYLVILVAAKHYDRGEYQYGVYWAKKGMDLFDFFYIKFNKKTREAIKKESKDYAHALKMFEYGKSYFDMVQYHNEKGIHFYWEDEFFFNQKALNNNQIISS